MKGRCERGRMGEDRMIKAIAWTSGMSPRYLGFRSKTSNRDHRAKSTAGKASHSQKMTDQCFLHPGSYSERPWTGTSHMMDADCHTASPSEQILKSGGIAMIRRADVALPLRHGDNAQSHVADLLHKALVNAFGKTPQLQEPIPNLCLG